MHKFTFSFKESLTVNGISYRDGDIEAVFTIDKSLKLSDSYAFAFYNDLMMCLYCTGTNDDDMVKRVGRRSFTFDIPCYRVWMPGHYRMLVTCGYDRIMRFDVELTDDMRFEVSAPTVCDAMSDDGLLAKMTGYTPWRLVSRFLGTGQFRRWVISRLRNRELCRSISVEQQVRFSNNLLCTFRNLGPQREYVKVLLSVIYRYCDIEALDCSELAARERLGDVFDRGVTDLLNLAEDRTKFHTLWKVGVLATEEGAKLADKVREEASIQSGLVFGGSREEIEAVCRSLPSVCRWIPGENRLEEEPYSCREMVYAFLNIVRGRMLSLSPEALDKLCKTVVEGYGKGVLSTWSMDDVRHYVMDSLLSRYQQRVAENYRNQPDCGEVQPEDIDEARLTAFPHTMDALKDDLNAMIGLGDIKQSILTLSNRMQFYAHRRRLGLPTADGAAFHAVFTGNPGTGKTTVAKMLGKIYHALGLLSKGDVVCVDRTQIVGRYIGGTEENMRRILREAKGNVLFVDEAYTLCPKGDSNDFGPHAIECLLSVLAQKNPDMIVIFAGYRKEMEEMLTCNPGLKGRFPYTFHFPDYSADELMQIAMRMFRRDEYRLSPEAGSVLQGCIAKALEWHDETFSNARWVEQFVYNGIVPALADRLAARQGVIPASAYQLIEAADIAQAFAQQEKGRAVGQKRRSIGFLAA